jgi:diguanylate cyclase (GGDEF)-like protein/putative nucleotidyltransferase with HDIG domain
VAVLTPAALAFRVRPSWLVRLHWVLLGRKEIGMRKSRLAQTWIPRASVVGLLAVLCFLAGFAIITQAGEAAHSRRAGSAGALSGTYQDARFWIGQEESLERKYRLEPGPVVRAAHLIAERRLEADLGRLRQLDPSAQNQSVVARLLSLEAAYRRVSAQMLAAVDAHRPALVIRLDHSVVDPVFTVIQDAVYRNAAVAGRRARAETVGLRRTDAASTRAIAIAFGVGIVLLLSLGFVITYFRRRLDATVRAELHRLGRAAMTDPLTGLRNHRAFHEDLDGSLRHAQRSGACVSLVMLDLDSLKQVNDSLGHQAGDDRLRLLADAIRSAASDPESAYRIGGDEFAVVLDGLRTWEALEFTQRLGVSLASVKRPHEVSVSAGIAERLVTGKRDELIYDADLALLMAKRTGQDAVIFTPEIGAEPISSQTVAEHHHRTLAGALALAVDAKDSYTRSHSQTVSELSALIATELGLNPQRIARVRLAGLLHDVGKIGIPDAVLTKPAKLTEIEYEVMKTHAQLGHDIVLAAELPDEARWILHHHERYEGNGYPDRIGGADIPLESRIIFVADSFEAMTSDRPYRQAPGRQYAIDELHRHSGTQFDPGVVDALDRALEQPTQSAAAEPVVDAAAPPMSFA